MRTLLRHLAAVTAAVAAASMPVGAARAGSDAQSQPSGAKPHVVIFDFHCPDDAELGGKLADSIRLRLARHASLDVVDGLTTREVSGPLGLEADADKVANLMTVRLGATVGLYGTVSKRGRDVRAEIRCVDLRDPSSPAGWTRTFADSTERAVAVVNRQVAEAVTGQAEWKPPEYGDEPEPSNFARPLNANGDFESAGGWAAPDNVSTFIEPGPEGRGKILRIRTDLSRDAWLDYQRRLRFGQADPARPPRIGADTSYNCVGALEGVHFRSEWLKATPGQRYWLTADCIGQGGAKIFLKGFRRTEHGLDGLPESLLIARGLTPEAFARIAPDERRKIIVEEERKHPELFHRECYRWYLNCAKAKGRWLHLAAPVPPRGGLPANVEWLQIQVYAYWPPGVYLFDNVHLYKDPNQAAPLPEEQPRTPNFGKTSDVVEKAATQPSGMPHR